MSGNLTEHERQILTDLFLFDSLDAALRQQLISCCPEAETVVKGQPLYRSHADAPALCVLLSGHALVYRSGQQEHPMLLRQLCAGDVFGVAALYGGFDYVTDVIARSDCRVIFLSQALLSDCMHASLAVAENYIRFLSGRVRFLNAKIAELTAGTADNRLLTKLSAMADENGTLHLPCSMRALAQQLDISRSSLYRALDELQQQGRIEKSDSGWRLL